MLSFAHLDDRAVVAVSGQDAAVFLQGLLTNDVLAVPESASVYAALLTPQGKILFDFVVFSKLGAYFLDCWAGYRDALVTRLLLYRLRSKVVIEWREDLSVVAAWNGAAAAEMGVPDPRPGGLGWRGIAPRQSVPANAAKALVYCEHRLDCGVPDGPDFGQDKMLALDGNLEELHGVSFEKGCYVGQELTARMKHRGTARKRLFPVVALEGTLPVQGTSVTADQREIGTVTSTYGQRGFALLRLDRLADAGTAPIETAGTRLRVVHPSWLSA